jgi:uncharacterized protein RhaS with RHS repeats
MSETGTTVSFYRARYYDSNVGRFISEDRARYEFANLYAYVGGNPILWQDPWGLWKCQKNDCRGLHPDLKKSLDCFEKCAKAADPDIADVTVTCGTSDHPPTISKNGVAKGDPHYWGTAVDIGHNSNPGLSMPLFFKCFQECFPHKDPPIRTWGSYAQPEYNSDDPSDGYHYHIQFYGGAKGGQGFSPAPIHPHAH